MAAHTSAYNAGLRVHMGADAVQQIFEKSQALGDLAEHQIKRAGRLSQAVQEADVVGCVLVV